MAAEHQYFYEDEVYKINKKGNIEFGMVLENSELVSSDESDVEESEKIKKGFIRVYWHTTGIEEVVAEKKVGLADRSLMPGDVVRRLMKGQDTQRGYCRHMRVTACVQVVGTNQIINNISSNHLVPIEDYVPDIAVCLDSWVGGIKVVHSKLHLRLPDKSTVVISDPESNGFDSVFTDKKSRESEYCHHNDYYPGQVLWGPMSVLTDLAHWKHHKDHKNHLKQNKNKNVKVVVEQVEVESVGVHWQCRAYSKEGSNADKEQPKMWLQNDDLHRLKLLNVFEPCTLQVGDRNRYVLKAEDEIITREQWKRNQKKIVTNTTDPPPPPLLINKLTRAKLNEDSKKLVEEKGNIKSNLDDNTEDGNVDWYTDTSDGNDSDYSNSSAASTGTIKKHPHTKSFTKSLHKKKLKKPKKSQVQGQTGPTVGSNLIVETVSTMSTADVVWQDGSIEVGIPSTELYPIHHLDDQEFFPGDFVIENREDACMRVYGVVQSMDHAGRTATIKWFKTYTSSDDPQPTLLTESEVSVYDLKDHPDFLYRPGTVVIRVANFVGEDQNSTAGQVLDNHPEGKVRVCWAEGHTSMCWPQDLYKVGDYDSDEGELWDDATSEDGSWMTDSEEPTASDIDKFETEEENLKPKLAANIEKARVAMSRLEEIFTQNPSLQTADVMKKLLEVYKDCRYLDRLMGTSFFDESYFEGLIERVRERGRANAAQRVQDQLDRFFTPSELDNNTGAELVSTGECLAGRLADLEGRVVNSCSECGVTTPTSVDGKPPCFNVCVKLCSLILGQLLEAHAEVMKRFGGGATSRMSLSEAAKSPGSSSSSTTSQPEQQDPSADTTPTTTLPTATLASSPLPPSSLEPNAEAGGANERLKRLLVNGSVESEVKAEESETAATAAPLDTAAQTGMFSILDTAPNSHKYKLAMFHPNDSKSFFKTLRSEIKLLKTFLPPGIFVKAFEDRMDLLSVMVRGPENTPYEGGLFLFDLQLSQEYPKTPPHCHYISYCSDRLNPNLYEDGKVCVSLLGTWSGKGTEIWTDQSNLLQILISIQGLILVMEPYFNEAGYEKQKGSQQGRENSRMYNEMVLLKLVQSMTKIALHPSPVFLPEIHDHLKHHAYRLCERLDSWLGVSEQYNLAHPVSPTTPTSFRQLQGGSASGGGGVDLPEFPLIPASKGFCLTLRKSLLQFKQVLDETLSSHSSHQQPTPSPTPTPTPPAVTDQPTHTNQPSKDQ